MYSRNMVCVRYVIVNTLHKGDKKDDDDDNFKTYGMERNLHVPYFFLTSWNRVLIENLGRTW
jgi:hypothetical protein